MSRHRYVRNLAEDDYYDDYDDDDDYYEDDDDQDEYRPPTTTTATIQAAIPKKTNTNTSASHATKPSSSSASSSSSTATTIRTSSNKSPTPGVTKPPPGWDRPSSQQQKPTSTTINSTTLSSPSKPIHPGITKPPPGWGKPQSSQQPITTSNSHSSSANSSTKTNSSQDKTKSSAAPTTMVGGISKPPPGWGKPAASTPVKQDPNVSKILSSVPPLPPRKPTTLDFTTKSHEKSAIQSNTTTATQVAPTTATASSSSTSSAPPKPLPKSLLENLQSPQQLKSQLTMVVMGHVDAGKSTLVGQLLVQCGQISTRVAQKFEQQATSIGKSSFGLAWILDETEQERSRGVTMDIATKSLSLEQHDIILLDAPGHADFVPRMITGASSATVGLLVIAATPNEFDAGWNRGQTKEHVILARGLGVTQLIVAVNKLDVVQWNQARYQEIVQRVHPFLLQQGFAADRITYCPISGLSGVNIMMKQGTNDKDNASSLSSSSLLYQWYSGPTLLESMNRLLPVPRNLLFEKPFRMIVTDIYSDGSSSHKTVQVRGRVIQGVVQLHDACVLLPIGDETTISKMETFVAGSPASTASTSTTTTSISTTSNHLGEFAVAGELIDVTLTGIESSMRVSVGSIVSHAHIPLRPRISTRCRAKVWILPELPPVVGPILRGVQVLFHMHHLDIPATISKLLYIISKTIDVGTSGEHLGYPNTKPGPAAPHSQQPQAQRPRFLSGGVTAVVEITLTERICMENFVDCRPLGRFALRKSGETIGVGVIDSVL